LIFGAFSLRFEILALLILDKLALRLRIVTRRLSFNDGLTKIHESRCKFSNLIAPVRAFNRCF
jgi:hypothetical protein